MLESVDKGCCRPLTHIWKCHKVFKFWGIVHETVQKILNYDIPMSYMVLYLCNFNFTEGSIRVRDKYLVKNTTDS